MCIVLVTHEVHPGGEGTPRVRVSRPLPAGVPGAKLGTYRERPGLVSFFQKNNAQAEIRGRASDGGAVQVRPGQARSGQVRFITRPKSRTMKAKRKKTFESQQNEGAQMSNELESDGAMVMNLESSGVDGAGHCWLR